MADFKKHLETVENGQIHVDFLLKVEAFKNKHSTSSIPDPAAPVATADSESKALLVMEAVKLYEEFFLGNLFFVHVIV